MLSAFTNSFKIPELRQRILFTIALIFLCRLISVIPTPGVNAALLRTMMDRMAMSSGDVGFMGLLDLFSGGALTQAAIGALGIMPSISASIILQLLTAVVPALERLAREGDAGRQQIIQYGRYLTVALCLVQGCAMAAVLLRPAALGLQVMEGEVIVTMARVPFILWTILTMTTGTMMLMWLGEQITARGIGNGISLIITISIVSRLPGAISQSVNMFRAGSANVFMLVAMLVLAFLVIGGVIAVTQAQRKIPAVRQAGCGPQDLRRAEHLYAAARELFRRYAHHLRAGHPDVPATAPHDDSSQAVKSFAEVHLRYAGRPTSFSIR